jgi:GTP-binding protein HflX
MSKGLVHETEIAQPCTLALGVYLLGRMNWHVDDYFDEFLRLLKTVEVVPDETMFIQLRLTDRAHFLTRGKMMELVTLCEEKKVKQIICSALLSPLQQRNIEDATGCQVIDRAQLILEMFRRSATTAEGRIQVEMAELQMLKSRLSGHGREMGQQAFGASARGEGETKKEYEKRLYERLVGQAHKRLEMLQKTRQVQRRKRLSSGLPLVCLIGYTNAGKSSLLNALTKSAVLVEDKLFATLDTTTRELFLATNKKILISDTVGFISQLPHHLVKAFRSTLDELRYAHLLLHVIDASNHAWREQIVVVHETLADLKVEKPMLYLFNKVDKLSEEERIALEEAALCYVPHVFTSTRTKDGVASLRQAVIDFPSLWTD